MKKTKVKAEAPKQVVYKNDQDLVEATLFEKVLLTPRVAVKSQYLKDFVPKKDRAWENEYVDMFLDKIFISFGEKLSKLKNKPLSEIVAHLVQKRKNNIKYGNKVWKE